MKRSTTIEAYKKSDYAFFTAMFGIYFRTDFKFELAEEKLETICAEIVQQVQAGIVFLDLLRQNGVAKGFVLYQIDSLESDWCEREGCGFIREIFIMPELRGKKLGTDLVYHAECTLKERMVPCIYLTSDESEQFWVKLGYCDSGETSTINHDRIFIKRSVKQ